MKTQVRIISANSISDVEEKVNKFINDNDIEIIDIKISLAVHIFLCAIIYKPAL